MPLPAHFARYETRRRQLVARFMVWCAAAGIQGEQLNLRAEEVRQLLHLKGYWCADGNPESWSAALVYEMIHDVLPMHASQQSPLGREPNASITRYLGFLWEFGLWKGGRMAFRRAVSASADAVPWDKRTQRDVPVQPAPVIPLHAGIAVVQPVERPRTEREGDQFPGEPADDSWECAPEARRRKGRSRTNASRATASGTAATSKPRPPTLQIAACGNMRPPVQAGIAHPLARDPSERPDPGAAPAIWPELRVGIRPPDAPGVARALRGMPLLGSLLGLLMWIGRPGLPLTPAGAIRARDLPTAAHAVGVYYSPMTRLHTASQLPQLAVTWNYAEYLGLIDRTGQWASVTAAGRQWVARPVEHGALDPLDERIITSFAPWVAAFPPDAVVPQPLERAAAALWSHWLLEASWWRAEQVREIPYGQLGLSIPRPAGYAALARHTAWALETLVWAGLLVRCSDGSVAVPRSRSWAFNQLYTALGFQLEPDLA